MPINVHFKLLIIIIEFYEYLVCGKLTRYYLTNHDVVMNYILIIGAKNEVAKELAKIYAKERNNLYLAGRNISKLKDFANDLMKNHNINIGLKELDIEKFNTHPDFYNSLEEKPNGVIIVTGYDPGQKNAMCDWDVAYRSVNVNYAGPMSILNIISHDMENRKKGFIIGVSSVAGDRGRGKNYIYGSSKSAFSAYLSGLRNRLYKNGVHVLTVKPGYIYSKISEERNLPRKLTAQPIEIAKDIYKAQQSKKNIIYTKWFWKYIMFIVKNIPEFIFKRTNI